MNTTIPFRTSALAVSLLMGSLSIGLLPAQSAYAADARATRNLPDLTIAFTSPGRALQPGQSFKLRMRERNIGRHHAPAHHIRPFLSKGNQRIYFARSFRVSRLAPGSSRVIVRHFRMPRVSTGHYRLCVTTDYRNRIRELKEFNNTACTWISISNRTVALPDLVVTRQQHARRITHVRVFAVMSDITNIGNARAGASRVMASLYKGRLVVVRSRSQEVGPLAPGQRVTKRLLLVIKDISPGRYTLCTRADVYRKVIEAKEDNNLHCRPLEIVPRGGSASRLPDLTPTIERFRIRNGRAIFRVVINNRGQGRAGSTVMEHYYLPASGGRRQLVGTIPVAPIRPFNSRRYDHTRRGYGLSARPGRYRYCFKVDAKNWRRESNERNNTVCVMFTIPKPLRAVNTLRGRASVTPARLPDLEPEVFPGTFIAIGKPYRVRVVDHNRSNTHARSHRISLYLKDKGRKIPIAMGNIRAVALPPHMSREYNHRVIMPNVEPGVYQLCSYTDAGRQVRESNERNNEYCRTVNMLSGGVIRRRPMRSRQ